jgi:hypothetical protein
MAAVALQESVEALRMQDKQTRCDIAITSLLQQSLRTQSVTGCASVDVGQPFFRILHLLNIALPIPPIYAINCII